MANMVHNTINFIGNKTNVELVYEKIKADLAQGQFDLLKLLPISQNPPAKDYAKISKNFQPQDEKSKHPLWYQANWYDYNLDHLGTKWVEGLDLVGDYQYQAEKNQAQLTFNFETAWSALSDDCLKQLASQYDVDINYSAYDQESYEWYTHKGVKNQFVKSQHYEYELNWDPTNPETYDDYDDTVEAFFDQYNDDEISFFENFKKQLKKTKSKTLLQ